VSGPWIFGILAGRMLEYGGAFQLWNNPRV
jgi:hypothetical protein